MSAFNKLAQKYLSADIDPPTLKRIGSAVLGKGLFEGMPLRNLLQVGSHDAGLVLVMGDRRLLIPWSQVESASPPFGIFPREKFLVGDEKIPLILPKGVVTRPVADAGR